MGSTTPMRRLTGMAATALALTIALPGITAAAKPTSSTGNSWTTGAAVSGVEQPDPTRGSQLGDIAVSSSGLAVAAWDRFDYAGTGSCTVGANVETAGRWGTPFVISPAGGCSGSPRVAASPDGGLAVSWTQQDPYTSSPQLQRVQVAVRRPGSTTWSTATLATGPVGGVQGLPAFVPVAFDGSGNLTAAWTLWDGTKHVVQTATLPNGGAWSLTTSLSGTLDGLYVSLAANARGEAAIAWSVSPYASGAGTWAAVAKRSAAGTWGMSSQVSETLSNTVGYVTSPIVGLDANGFATVAYFASGVEAVRETPTGWTSPQVVIGGFASTSSYGGIDLGVASNGNAVVSTTVFDAAIGVDRSSVWVAGFAPPAGWSPKARLTDPTVPVDAYAARAAISPDGALILVSWIDHYHGTAQVARVADLGVTKWTTTTVGKGTAFSSFQEVMGLDAASSTQARVLWKIARGGTQWIGADVRG